MIIEKTMLIDSFIKKFGSALGVNIKQSNFTLGTP